MIHAPGRERVGPPAGYTAHLDTFARDNLPAADAWPDLINLQPLGYPERINCASVLLEEALATGHGEHPCLVTDDGIWSYRVLDERARRIANVLVHDAGLRPGERVLLRAPNSPLLVACWFAVMKAGGIAVSTMPLLRAPELTVIARKARTRLALCDARLTAELEAARDGAPELERIIAFGPHSELERAMADGRADFETVATAADDVCLIAFTSGTTGEPKGTCHFHRDLLAVCDTVSRRVLAPRAGARFIGSPPLAFTFGLGGLVLFPLHARAATVLVEQPSPPVLAQAAARHRANVMFTAPTAYRAMLDAGAQAALASLEMCVSAGETLPLPVFEGWERATGIRIVDAMGSTEMLHMFITATGDRIRPGATGVPVPGYEARVLDEAGAPAPPGAPGRLAVRGPTGCRYLADDRQREYVVDGWNLTGDTFIADEDGYFWFQARNDDMIVSSGYNIAGPEVEAALLTHPAVAECAVVGVPDERRGALVKAFVVRRESASPTDLVDALQAHVRSTIAPYKYPRAIEFVDALPRTETGKVQRFRLRT